MKATVKASRRKAEAIATKFVHHDIPELKTLQYAKVYQLRVKLNKGEKMNRAERNWLAEAIKNNSYFERAVPLLGYRFGFEDVLKTFIVKQYGIWTEYYAPDKTSLRHLIYGRIDQMTVISN